jgi:DinB superfamily
MKRQISNRLLKTVIIPLCTLFSLGIVQAQDTKNLWTETDRQYTLDNMKRTRDELIKETENLTPAQWTFRDSAHRWSISEVVEHLALWEIVWAREIGMGCRNKPQPELNSTASPDSYYTGFIMEDKPHVAPDFAVPTGFIKGKDNLTFFLRGREQAIKFIETTKYDMRAQFELTNMQYPRNMHHVLIYQWGHVDRHLRQIAKLKAHKDFPTNSDKMSDEIAIKAAIIAQSTAWANRDSVGYLNSFADETITQTMHNYADGTYTIAKGKNAIQEKLRANLKANPNKTYESNIERKDWLIKILSPEWAWVNFTQRTTNVKGEIYTSYDTRLMNKVRGIWRLTALNALWDYKNVVNKAK